MEWGARTHARAPFGENIDAALALMDRSLALNPSFAEGWYSSGVLRNFAGNPIWRSPIWKPRYD